MAKTYIQLGRTGDIINLLPLLWADAQNGRRKSLMVASEFSGVLDGVSYVDPIIFEGAYAAIDHAVAQAKLRPDPFVCTQVNGPVEQVAKFTYHPAGLAGAVCTSFQKESWRVAGRLEEWHKGYPLVFDRRDPGREQALLNRVLGPHQRRKKRPLLLLSLGGVSSPIATRRMIEELLSFRFDKQYTLVDLSTVKAERIYDLLALYERAGVLISTDSAPLHLARAVPELPVIALTNDTPMLWHGSAWQPQHIVYCRYKDLDARFKEIIGAIRDPSPIRPRGGAPAIVHVWNDYTPVRHEPNFWPLGDPWFPLPIKVGMCGRDSNGIGDTVRLPFLKDCLRIALQVARDGDYICLTRPDTMIQPEAAKLTDYPAFYCYRIQRPEGFEYPIVDMFCARKDFWQAQMPAIPDLLLGNDHYWSHALWAIFSTRGARYLHNLIYRNEPTPAPRV